MNWGDIWWGLMWPPVWTFGLAAALHFAARLSWREAMRPWLWRWLAGCLGGVVAGLIPPGSVQESVIDVAYAAGGVVLWFWLRRKRRGKAGKLAGAKSKALLAALVRRAREAATPRPVLRPQPGGARCA